MASHPVNELRHLLGADNVRLVQDDEPVVVDGLVPKCLVQPQQRDEVARLLALTAQLDLAVIPCGNATQLCSGMPPRRYDVALQLTRMNRVIAHEAGDMTVTVEAGATLGDVNGVLAAAGQYLPLDPPRPEQVTVGGMIAADQWGPWRSGCGKVRDHLIGVTVAMADGQLVKGGGRVVKNVAGYDLMKLFTGSCGTLGVIVEATFKVRPRPAVSVILVVEARTIEAANETAAKLVAAHLPVSLMATLCPAAAALVCESRSPVLLVGASGSGAEVDVVRQRVADLCHPNRVDEPGMAGAAVYERLRDWSAAPAWWGARVSLPSTQIGALARRVAVRFADGVAMVAHPLAGAAILRGSVAVEASQLLEVRQCVADLGGYAVFDRLPAALKPPVDVWGQNIPGLELMRGIKVALDPQRRLSPGRFVGGI